MAQQQLSLETLKDFDFGRSAAAVQLALKKAVLDILDRPGDKSARKVVLTTELRPRVLQDGDVVDADVNFIIEVKTPKWATAPVPANVTRGGALLFQELAPDNPDQTTIEDTGALDED